MGSSKNFELKKRRYFSNAFKRQIVELINSGKYSVSEVSQLYEIHFQTLYRWLHQFRPNLKGAVIMKYETADEAKINLQLKKKIAELERLLGQKTAELELKDLELEYKETMLQVISQDLGLDLKKIQESYSDQVAKRVSGGEKRKDG